MEIVSSSKSWKLTARERTLSIDSVAIAGTAASVRAHPRQMRLNQNADMFLILHAARHASNLPHDSSCLETLVVSSLPESSPSSLFAAVEKGASTIGVGQKLRQRVPCREAGYSCIWHHVFLGTALEL